MVDKSGSSRIPSVFGAEESSVSWTQDFGDVVNKVVNESLANQNTYAQFMNTTLRTMGGESRAGTPPLASVTAAGPTNPYFSSDKSLAADGLSLAKYPTEKSGRSIESATAEAAEAMERSTMIQAAGAMYAVQRSNILMFGSMFNNFVKGLKSLFTGQ